MVFRMGKPKGQSTPPPLVSAVAEELGIAGDLKQLGRGKLDGKRLTPERRRVLLLLNRSGKSQTELARLMGVSRAMIQKDLRTLRKDVAKSLDLDAVVGDLVLS